MPAAPTIQAATTDKQPVLLDFTPIGRTKIQAMICDEPVLSSDGRALLIREAAAFNGIIDEMVASISDERDQSYVKHTLRELIMQRVTRICHGYEDANDCDFLKSSRTSCHRAEANQFRLFLHSAAYVIMHGLRTTALKGTELANATFDTIRLRLLKIAARVQIGKTFVRFHLPESCPVAPIFRLVVSRIDAARLN